jgi:predicted MFS family arabinose efflux permease
VSTGDAVVPTDRPIPTQASPSTVVAISTASIGLGAAIGFLFGFIATLLIEDLGLSRGAVGLLTSVYFGSTGIGSVAGGLVTDKLGARLAVAVDLVLVVVAAVAIVVFRSYAILLVASVLAGAGYSLANAGTNVAIAASVPLRRRALAMTIKTAGVPAVGVVGAFTAPWAGSRYGWPVVMAAIGVLALIALVATFVWLPSDRASVVGVDRSTPLPPGFLWFPLGSFFLLAGSQPLFSWIVPFFVEAVGIDVASAGRASAVASTGGIVIMLLIARRSDRLGPQLRVRTMAALSLVSAIGVTVTLSAVWLGAAIGILGTFIGLGAQLGVVGNLHAAIADRAPNAVGRASGVTMTGYYLGALAAPVTFGVLIDVSGAYVVPWVVMAACLVVAAGSFWQADRQVPDAET